MPEGNKNRAFDALAPARAPISGADPRSRGAICPGCGQQFVPFNQRARGMPGAQCTRSRACSVENTRVSHHRSTGITRHSLRDRFNGFLRALPGDRAFLSPSPAALAADLTPASRRQDHTTSPSAESIARHCALPASTASRPASVTLRNAPLWGGTAGVVMMICPTGRAKYFRKRDWTGVFQNCPTGKSPGPNPPARRAQCGPAPRDDRRPFTGPMRSSD
jgi:hypothetical protein